MKISIAVASTHQLMHKQFISVAVTVNGIYAGTLRLLPEEVEPFKAIIERGLSETL